MGKTSIDGEWAVRGKNRWTYIGLNLLFVVKSLSFNTGCEYKHLTTERFIFNRYN